MIEPLGCLCRAERYPARSRRALQAPGRLGIRATRLLGLRFTGIDMKSDAAGQLKFLELNPSPMFLGFDADAGTHILGAFVQRLARHCA